MLKYFLLVISLLLLLTGDIYASEFDSPWHEETKVEGKFCSTLEVTARKEGLNIDCMFYNNSFHFNVVETFSFDKWAYDPRWVFIAFSEQLIKTPLKKDKYTAVTVMYDFNDKATMYMQYRDVYMCTVYWIKERNERGYQDCIYEFMKVGGHEYR